MATRSWSGCGTLNPSCCFTDWAVDPGQEDLDMHGDLMSRLSENLGDQYRRIPASEIVEAVKADSEEAGKR